MIFKQAILRVLTFPLVLILPACVSDGTSPEALSKTFESAYITVPKDATTNGTPCASRMTGVPFACPKKIDTSKKHAVLLFMHGCAGLDHRNLEAFRDTIITIAPNSFARPGRIKQCGAATYKTSAILARLKEVHHAAERLKTLPWVDTSRLFLGGFSEGGITTANYEGDEFIGRIILGWPCYSGLGMNGISGPDDTPVLAVMGGRDKYHRSASKVGRDCGEYFGNRPHSRSLIIPDGTHNIVTLPETREAIEHFISTVAP
jgi:predicted esterase